MAWYQHFDSVGVSITGYPWAGDVYYTYATRDDPERSGTPLFDHGPDFGYFYLGAICYGDELWDGGEVGDLNGDGEKDDLDRLIWQDTLTAGRDCAKPFEEGRGAGRVELGYLQPGERKEAVFRFRTYGVDRFEAGFELLSTRGGVVRGEIPGR